jgi:hypothetical protein
MTELDISALLIDILAVIEPDARGATFSLDADLRDELGLDDDDLDRFAREVQRNFGVVIPERDRPLLCSLSGAVAIVRRARRAADVVFA